MTTIPNLFDDCVLPGCPHPVEAPGRACSDCLEAFGPMLQPAPAATMTAEEIARRDSAVRDIYAARTPATHAEHDPAPAEDAEQAPAQAPGEECESKPNQRCWLCEERRTCTRRPAGWECRTCATIR